MSHKESEPRYSSQLHTGGLPPSDFWEDHDNEPQLLSQRLNLLTDAVKHCNLSLDKNTRLLEIGSGNGKMLEYLRNHDLSAVGVDALPRNKNTEPVVAARVEALPFLDNSFDIVTSMQVFDPDVYDLQDQGAMLNEIVRVLRPGGIFAAQLEEIDPDVLSTVDSLSEVPATPNTVQRVFVKR